jgi:hypothetical protein
MNFHLMSCGEAEAGSARDYHARRGLGKQHRWLAFAFGCS